MRLTDRPNNGVRGRVLIEQLADRSGSLFKRDAALDDLGPGEFKDALAQTVVHNEGSVRRGRYLGIPRGLKIPLAPYAQANGLCHRRPQGHRFRCRGVS